MFFLNLSAGEFLTILGAVGGIVTALYLLDRSRRKQLVSTLRFWTPAAFATEQQSRKRVQEPWSLVLQLVSLVLLLLALARLEWGTRGPKPSSHVLLLDVSSATTSGSGRSGALLNQEKALAKRYLTGVSARDRVMLVRVNDVATPVTPFTSDRAQLIKAIDGSASTYSALYIDRALAYARQALTWSDVPGEVVYVGPERIAEGSSIRSGVRGLRVVPVEPAKENCGIRGIGVTRNEAENSWQATVRVKNYGSTIRNLRVSVQFGGSKFAPRSVRLRPGQETSVEYEFVTTSEGQLTARLEPRDDFPLDDQAAVTVPAYTTTRVFVYTTRSDAWAPLFSANARLDVRYFPPSAYQARPVADLMILDGFGPSGAPGIPSLFINPPRNRSPLSVKSSEADQMVTKWIDDGDLGAGLRAKDFILPRTSVFQTFAADVPVASVAAGPVVVVRPAAEGKQKIAFVGFDLLGGPLRFQVSSPLLFANLVRWLSPGAFRRIQVTADHVGVAGVLLDASENPDRVRAETEAGNPVTFTTRGNRLEFYMESPAVVHVTSGDREHILSLVLPEVAEFGWNPPANTSKGLPSAATSAASAVGLWRELALLGGLGLLIEWVIYGRRRMQIFRRRGPEAGDVPRANPERELVSR